MRRLRGSVDSISSSMVAYTHIKGLGHWNHGAMLYSVDSEEQPRVLGGEWWLDQGCLQRSVLSL